MSTPPISPRARRQAGFSLIEMMVALVAGMIVVAAVIAFMMSSFSSNADYVRSTRLTQELRNTLDLATRDLQRAGYDDNALLYLGNANTSPFAPILVSGSCVVYAYDRTHPNGQA
ncbi:MAG: PilW family protein, partial [Arenimonas sp.]